MAISLVDINQLTATTSQDKDMLVAVDQPSGGGFVIRKITKEDFFKLTGQPLEYTLGAGANDVFVFTASYKSIFGFFGGGSYLMHVIPTVGASSDGSTFGARMTAAGGLIAGNSSGVDGDLQMFFGSNTYNYNALDLEKLATVVEPLTGGTTSATEARTSVLIMDVGGTIATHTINFPAEAKIGWTMEIKVNDTIIALTLGGGVATIEDPLTTATDVYAKWVRTVEGGSAFWRRLV